MLTSIVVSSAIMTAIIKGPTILPDDCRAVAAVPYVVYYTDPHGAIMPLSGQVAWKEMPFHFDYPEELCLPDVMIVGYFTEPNGLGFGTWQHLGHVVPSADVID